MHPALDALLNSPRCFGLNDLGDHYDGDELPCVCVCECLVEAFKQLDVCNNNMRARRLYKSNLHLAHL